MRRFATSRRRGAAPIWSSTIGKRRSFAHASRPANRAGQLGGSDRPRARQPGSADFRVAGRRSCPGAMKKGVLVFLLYCAITVALTYPLILQMGSVLPNDAGDPALNTWILWWNTQTMPFSTAWWNAPAFFPAPGVMSFSENLLGLSLISTPLHWLGVGAADRVQRRLLSDVPSQRSWRVSAGIRADETPRRGLHRGTAVRLRALSHRAPAADSVARVVPDAVRAARPASLSPRPEAEVARTVWQRGGFSRGSATATTCCFSACSSVCGFCGLRARGRGRGSFSRSASRGSLPRFRYCRFCCAIARFTHRSASRAISAPSVISAPTWRACCTRQGTSRCGDRSMCFGVPKGSCFRGSPSSLLVVAGAIFVRDRGHAHVNSWTLVRRILIVLTVATAVVSASAVDRRSVAPRAVRHSPAVSCESDQAAYVFARARACCSH